MDQSLKPSKVGLTIQLNHTGGSEYHRDARTGFILPLSAIHLSEITPTMRQELDESSRFRNIHTSRIQTCLQTQLINFFKGPGVSLDLFKPDLSQIIDLGQLKLCEKPEYIKDWTRDGWAFRWDTESIRQQLGYDKNTARTIDLDQVIYHLFTKLRFVWVPRPKDPQYQTATTVARIDPFSNFNNVKTIPSLDASYLNISSAFIEEFINQDEATVIYHRQIRSKLRSETAQQIASMVLADFDLSPAKSRVKQTTPLDQQSYVDQLYQGEKKLNSEDKTKRLKWSLFVQDSITRHIYNVRDAFGFSSFKFVNNRKRGSNYLAWFEFTWPEGGHSVATPLVALPKDIPELAHPDLFSEPEVSKFTTRVNPKQHYTWEEVLVIPQFIEEAYIFLEEFDIPKNALNDIVIAYSPNAAKQIPKTVKRWISPFKIWIKNRQDRLRATPSEGESRDHPDESDHIDFGPVQAVTSEAKSTTGAQKKINSVKKVQQSKVLFTNDLINEVVISDIKKILATGYCEFNARYDLEVDDFIDWNIPKFSAYHLTNSGPDHKETCEKWRKLFKGWVKNAFQNPMSLKDFRYMKFDISMITEAQPFKDVINDFPENIVSIMHQVLKILEITYPEDRKSVGAWQRQAWTWLREDRSLKELGVDLPKIRVSSKNSK